MGTAFRPAKTSPASWDAFADVDAFVDAVLAELTAMAADGTRRTGSVRSQGSLPRAPPADRFSGPVLSDQESRHELPALPIIVDHRAGGANGSWLPAFPMPGVWAAVQRADRHGAEPGSGPDRHRVPKPRLP